VTTERIENFFALEGLDGVGKTTTIEGLRDKDFVVLKTPGKLLSVLRPIFEEQDTRARFMFYLTSVLQAGYQAKKYTAHEKVICDRYLLTTVAAHEAMGMSVEFMAACMPIVRQAPVPEMTFILTATEEARLNRLMGRPKKASPLDIANLKINNQILNGYRTWSETLGYPILEIDTTSMCPEDVIGFIERYAKKES
jgi:thymidylate kinase